MPRPKRRAATTTAEVVETPAVKRPKTSSRPKQSQFNKNKLMAWFKLYTNDDDPTQLGPDGMERFCNDIKVDPEDIAMLCIAYKMNAKNLGYFTQTEFLCGLGDVEVQCDTPIKLQSKLTYFYNLLNDPQTFKLIYRYAYDFARVSSKCLDSRVLYRFTWWRRIHFYFRTKINAAWTQTPQRQCLRCSWTNRGHYSVNLKSSLMSQNHRKWSTRISGTTSMNSVGLST